MSGVAIAYAISAAAANIIGALAVTSGARWSVRALDRMLAFAAGSPLLPKLAETGRSDVARATALMVLLMAGSIMVMPSARPRGMIVTLCKGFVFLSSTLTSAWPASCHAV